MRNRGVVEGREGLGAVTYSALIAVSSQGPGEIVVVGVGWGVEDRIPVLPLVPGNGPEALDERRQPSRRAEAWC